MSGMGDSGAGGEKRIQAAFAAAKAKGRAAAMPYLSLGYPTMDVSIDAAEAAAAAGADLIELGVPFSDPLADGPVIQASTQAALEAGATPAACLDAVRELRARGVGAALLLMGYYNPILAFGVEAYAHRAAEVGADGLIVPDLPLEEARPLEAACAKEGLALVFLLPRTASDERAALIASRTRGFLYLVSVVGVTGARTELAEGLDEFIARARRLTDKPLAVVFVISTPAQAKAVGALADGVIVGSALVAETVRAVTEGRDCAKAVGDFVGALLGA
jgi:tryptophan synthase alpha chain